MEQNTNNTKVDVNPRYFMKKILRTGCILLIAISVGCIHYKYVSTLFENYRNFSHLSDLEREMSFRTEMGFYYSYYKTVVQERPFIAGISKLMYDSLVEYPKDVNAFNRFNIHPEVIIGAIYRYLEPWLNTTAHRQCHMVDRGEGLSAVESCIGIGHPILFYLEAVWSLAGLLVAVIFLHGTVLSDTVLGGALAVAQYFANHGECTRVQWTPNERENMAAPLFFLQTCLMTMQLRDKDRKASFQLQVSIFIVNCLCLLFWQFTQFIFLTQIAIFFIMEQLKIIDLKTLFVFLHSHFCGIHMAVLLLHGNDMLKSSLYTSFFLIVSAYSLFFSTFRIKVKNRVDFFVEAWLIVLRVSIVICASLYLKKVISEFLDVEEDSHIWHILYSKFSDFKNFHTQIYTCSEVFDFLPWSSVMNIFNTLLLPMVILSIFNIVSYWIGTGVKDVKKYYEKSEVEIENDEDDDSGIENNSEIVKKKEKQIDLIDKANEEYIEDKFVCFLKNLSVDPPIFYNISQMVVFGVMAALVMRLKLLFVTQMCIVSSLIMNTKYYTLPKSRLVPLLWVVCAFSLARKMADNISYEMSHVGEFSDLRQEELLHWIASKTSPNEVFAGSMPISASVMLSTRRPIVVHPHYEHRETRQRAYSIYKVYGRFSAEELYEELTKMKVTYLIVEVKYCYGRSSKGCSFEHIWDTEAPELTWRPKLCHTLMYESTEHFYRVFANEHYHVFRVHDLSVRYMPRCFDT